MLFGLDGGHGFRQGEGDSGGVGPTGLLEAEVTLDVALRLRDKLQAKGQSVYMTRTDDSNPSLGARSSGINNAGCDYAISIHVNASGNTSARYVSTWIQGVGGEAEKLANCVQGKMVEATGWEDGGVRVSNFHMNRETDMPSILVEMGFITNRDEETALKSEGVREWLADAIADGIFEYLIMPNKPGKPGTFMGKVAILQNSTTYVPLDRFLEALGIGDVTGWDQATLAVSFSIGDKAYRLKIGSDVIEEV